jgi:hypothetical protein
MTKTHLLQEAIEKSIRTIDDFNSQVEWDFEWQRETPEILMCLRCIDRVSRDLNISLVQAKKLKGPRKTDIPE